MSKDRVNERDAHSGDEDPKGAKLTPDEIFSVLDQIKKLNISADLLARISQIFALIVNLLSALDSARVTIKKLQKIAFGSPTERNDTRDMPPQMPQDSSASVVGFGSPKEGKKKKGGHTPGNGRNKESDYPGAKLVECFLDNFKSGKTKCPTGCGGTMYWADAARFIRFIGQAPIVATRYFMQVARCNTCGYLLKATLPEGVSQSGPKYDDSCTSTVLVTHYGIGVPFNAIGSLQKMSGVSVAPSNQWDLVKSAKEPLRAVYDQLKREAANGFMFLIDDTTAVVQSLKAESKKQIAAFEQEKLQAKGKKKSVVENKPGLVAEKKKPPRKAIYTTAIVSKVDVDGQERVIKLYFTGHKHAGENMESLLTLRDKKLGPPYQVSDALAANMLCQDKIIVCLCLAHARRGVHDIRESFPVECQYVLDKVGMVYGFDEHCRKNKMSPSQRLKYHQENSEPVMNELKLWIDKQLGLGDPQLGEDKPLVEANSALGKALMYFYTHWHGLTQFLRYERVPIDNNETERAVKGSIRVRKTSGYYGTENGALMGDMAMSSIHTCEACAVNSIHYLTALIKYERAVLSNPSLWMPWNYQSQLPPNPSKQEIERTERSVADNGVPQACPATMPVAPTAAPANTAGINGGGTSAGLPQTAPAGIDLGQPLQTQICDSAPSKKAPQAKAEAEKTDPVLTAASTAKPIAKGPSLTKAVRNKQTRPRQSQKKEKPQCHWGIKDVWMRSYSDSDQGSPPVEPKAQPPP